jgi:hypothetical protein
VGSSRGLFLFGRGETETKKLFPKVINLQTLYLTAEYAELLRKIEGFVAYQVHHSGETTRKDT